MHGREARVMPVSEERKEGKELPSGVSVVAKRNLTNPFQRLFMEGYKGRPPAAGEGEMAEKDFEALLDVDAHAYGPSSIASADVVGYVESDVVGKRYVDVMRTHGLGGTARVSGEVEVVACGRDDEESDGPRRTDHYRLTAAFPADSARDRRVHEFRLGAIDAARDSVAHERAKAIFDAVAQYVDDRYHERYLGEFVHVLQEMMRLGMYAKDQATAVPRLERVLTASRRASNEVNRTDVGEQIAGIRRDIAERDKRPKAESDADRLAFRIIDQQIKDAKGDMVESLKLLEERAQLERWIHARKMRERQGE